MKITVNGKPYELAGATTGAMLLAELKITPATVVAEVNALIVKREAFLERELVEGDILELVTVVGGG